MVYFNLPLKSLSIIPLIFLIVLTNGLIDNPIFIKDFVDKPILYQSNDIINIYYPSNKISLNITSGAILNNGIDTFECSYSSPYFLIHSDNINHPLYIYSSSNDYLISLSDSVCRSKSLMKSTDSEIQLEYSTSEVFVDYMKETSFAALAYYKLDETEYITNLRCASLANEIIIYGKFDANKIIFTYLEKKQSLIISTGGCNVEDFMKCKTLDNSLYFCAFICDNKVNIYAYAYETTEYNNDEQCEIVNVFNEAISAMSTHTEVRMFNNSDDSMQLICAKNKNNKKMECLKLSLLFNEYEITQREEKDESDVVKESYKINNFNFTLFYENTIDFSIELSTLNNEHCFFKESIKNEYLFCCGGMNLISCARIDNNFNYIDSFNLTIPGNNEYLDLIVDSPNINIFYINQNSLYEYMIILPSCVDNIYQLIPLSSTTDNIFNLIIKEMETNYYIEFVDIPDDYGNITVDGELIDLNNTNNIFLVDDSKTFTFISLDEESGVELKIIYNIIIEETFSSQCFVNLKIIECYKSCRTCTKSFQDSTSENHNCMPNSCKESYYTDPDINTNCWSSEQKKDNWYVDYSQNKFLYCNDLCDSCDGPLDSNCLSCKSDSDLKYLWNNKCYNKCIDGYYPELQNNKGYYKCQPCYINCATCSEKGKINGMKCDSCPNNSIKFEKNCFYEINSKEKTFSLPDSTESSSCYQKYRLYILENTYECINNCPTEKYYRSNQITGLCSLCHSDCLTCRGNYTSTTSNCLSCLNITLNLYKGNCIEICPDGYYSLEKNDSQKECKSCYYTCATCEKGAEYNKNFEITKMNCLSCKITVDNSYEKYIYVDGNCFPLVIYEENNITFKVIEIISDRNTIKTCLDYNLSIYFGDYKCIIKPTYTYYVLDNENNTGVIKNCSVECLTCLGAPDTSLQNTNCIACSEGYFKTEDSETNCLLESNIPVNYYYKNENDNIYYKCYINCETCIRTLDHIANINDMGCELCINNYYKVSGTNNCFNISFLDDNINYYFSSEDHQFHKCYYSCKRCALGKIDDNHNCDECIDNYYFEEDTKNCYNNSYTEQGYYLDNFTINPELNELPKFKKCYQNCKTCNNSLINDEEMNCISCINDYYKIFGTTNCINDITNNGYYLRNGFAFQCEGNCSTCSNGKTFIDQNNVNNNFSIITNITYNCLSCSQSNNLYLVDDLKNCESTDFEKQGFYLKEESDGTKIFSKCYKSCSLCDKYIEIDPIENKQNHSCIECANNYYRSLLDNNTFNCYGDEMLELGYRLVRNHWQICHENCGSCQMGPTYENESLISQNCDSCIEGTNFIYQTTNCVNESYLEKGYYFDDKYGVYKECHISCISCEKYSNESEPKCIKCNTEKGYYNAVDKANSSCYNNETIEPTYALSTRFDENGNPYKIWALCYETCIECSKYGTEEDHGCTSCISKYNLVYNTSNCISNTYAQNNGYYFNRTFRQYVKCDKACRNCLKGPIDGNTNCKECNEPEGFYPIEGYPNSMCFNNETIDEGYFINMFREPYKWDKCYENCATCEYKGNKYDMKCISCRTNLKNIYNNTKYFILLNGNCIESCPDNLFLTKNGDCVLECPSGTYHFQLDYNNSCVEFCPEKYVINSDKKKCELEEFPHELTVSDFKTTISKNVSSYASSSKIIDTDNFQAQILLSNNLNTESQKNNKIASINNIDNALKNLRQKYSLSQNEPLIIVIVESKQNEGENDLDKNTDLINLGKDIEVIIYDNSGRKLELSECKDEQILISKYIGDLPYIDLNEAKDLSLKGIDAFNESDPFFNDICFPFKTNSSSDIILEDRRSDLFQNITFCDSGCNYTGIDYELLRVNCLCKIGFINNDNNIDNKGIILNNNKNEFPKELYKTNTILIKCTNLAFDKEIIKNNIGFYFMLCFYTAELICFLVFIKNGLQPIKNFMLIFEPISGVSSPPRLKNLLSLAEESNKNKENNKEKEIQKTILISQLLNKKKVKKITKEKNEIDDALVVNYTKSDNEEEDSNRKKLNEMDSQEDEKENKSESESESESDSQKEKKTRITTKRNRERKKSNKKNNLVYPKSNIVKEKPKHLKEHKNDKNEHPIDMLDDLSLHKKREKFRRSNDKKNTSKKETENMNLDSLREEEKNEKKSKKGKIKIEKKKTIKDDEKEEKDEKGTIIPYRNKNKKLSTKINIDKNSKLKNKERNNFITNEELSIIKYNEAIKHDKRTFSKMYCGYLIEKNFILNTFISDSFTDLMSIKINFLFFRLEAIFVLNALFYSDKYISSTYYNNGSLNFLTSLPRLFYSFFVTILVSIIFRFLSSSKRDIFEVIKKKDNKVEYDDNISIVLSNFKIKLIVFFICEFIFSFLSLFYVTSFCAVYQNTKLHWLYGCLETIVIDFIFCSIYSIFIASFRYLGLRRRIKCLYKFATLLNYIM